MSLWRQLARGWAALRHRADTDAEIAAEVASFVELAAEEHRARGLSEDDALRAAISEAGSPTLARESIRSYGWENYVERLGADVRYALRRLARSPGFSAAAVLTLALGSGAATAMFSVLDAVVLRPIAVADADRIVRMYETNPHNNAWTTSEPNYLDYRAQTRSFAAMGAIAGRSASLTGHGDPLQLNGAAATASYFAIFGSTPLIGRVYGEENDQPGGDTHVILLSEGIWRRIFGADSSVVGSTIQIDGAGYRVIGVMPAAYGYLPSDFWTPLAPSPTANRGSHQLVAFARLKDGVTPAQGQQDISAVAARLSKLYPKSNDVWGARLEPFLDFIVGPDLRHQVIVLFGAVAFVLLLACANVASLMLVRATTRQREVAVRVALGAARERIVRQLLTESVVLSLLGAVGGIAIAVASMPAIRLASPFGIARIDEVRLDGAVLLFAVLSAVLTGILFGVVPALQMTGGAMTRSLHDGGRAVSGRGARTRSTLVVTEVALATVLLIGAGLLGRSFLLLQEVRTGFTAAGVTQLTVTAPNDLPRAERPAFFLGIETALASVPGVRSIGAISVAPFNPAANTSTQYLAEGSETTSDFFTTDWRSVTAGVFRTLGIGLVRGRQLDARDVAGSVPVAVIDETAARRLFPGQDPIGRRVVAAQSARTPADYVEIVGVVRDIRDQTLAADPAPAIYLPEAQKPWVQMTFLVLGDGSQSALAGGLKRAFHEAAPGIPFPDLVPLDQNLDTALAPQRFTTWLLGVFAAVALLLAAIGLYGVVSYSVALRTNEIGLRLALGASPTSVATAVVRQACVLTATGVGVGCVLALAAGRAVSGMLFGVGATDAVTYATVNAMLLVSAAIAAVLPAWRAAAVDPLVALRTD